MIRLLNISFLITALFSMALLACKSPGQEFSGSESGTSVSPNEPPVIDNPDAVCDPFAEDPDYSYRQYGLRAKLFYLTDDQPRYENVVDYILNGNSFENPIFFNQLYVPTRPFDRGFVTQNGAVLKTPSGTTLYEYFALRFSSMLKLGPNDGVGNYQLAILSDDGSLLSLQDQNGNWQNVVDNDGVHPTKMACATTPVSLNHQSKIPLKLDYYQGPRFHISLVVMWRPWPTNPNDVLDPLCGFAEENHTYFDYTQNPPTPQPAYLELLSRGWKPLEPENYLLEQGVVNPCGEGITF